MMMAKTMPTTRQPEVGACWASGVWGAPDDDGDCLFLEFLDQQSLQPSQMHTHSELQLHFSPGQHFIPDVPSHPGMSMCRVGGGGGWVPLPPPALPNRSCSFPASGSHRISPFWR